jgi:hypothetical protein
MEEEEEKYVHCTLYYCLVLHFGLACAWYSFSVMFWVGGFDRPGWFLEKLYGC